MGVIGIIVTISTFIFGIFFTIRHFKISKTIEYIQRFNQPSMVEIRASIEEWVLLDKPEKEKIKIIYENYELMSKMRIFYNLLTEVAIAYEYGILNKKMTKDIWFPLLPRYTSLIMPWIYEQRIRGEDIGHSLERVSKEILTANNRTSWDIIDNKSRKKDV